MSDRELEIPEFLKTKPGENTERKEIDETETSSDDGLIFEEYWEFDDEPHGLLHSMYLLLCILVALLSLLFSWVRSLINKKS